LYLISKFYDRSIALTLLDLTLEQLVQGSIE
jgi:hypothetical protein